MARYEHLPIYKKAMDVAIHFEKVVSGFNRYHKYTLGTELRNKSRKIMELIVMANSSQDKLPVLLELREWLEELLILVPRICFHVLQIRTVYVLATLQIVIVDSCHMLSYN